MYTDSVDTVVATSPEDAMAVWAETCGLDYADESGRGVEAWTAIPDDKPVRLYYPTEEAATLTAAEWCAEGGRGFWGSTEF